MLESTANLRPLRDRVFVKELPWPNKSGGGIFLPDQGEKREEVWRAVVIAVGPGKPPIGLLRRAVALMAEWEDADGKFVLEEQSEKRERWLGDVQAGIAVGFGADVKPGDVVLVSKYVHTKVRVGGEWCSIIAASDILGVVTDGGDQVGAVLQRALERHLLNRGDDRAREMAELRADPERKRHLAEANALGEADARTEKERRAVGGPHAACECGANHWKTSGTITLLPGKPADGSVECVSCGREYPAEHVVQRPNGGAG